MAESQAIEKAADPRESALDRAAGGRYGLLAWVITPNLASDAIPAWDSSERERFNYELSQVDLVAAAITAVCQKVASAQFSIEGPERTARRWRDKLLSADWSWALASWVKEACRSSKGGYLQVVRAVPTWFADENGITERGRRAFEAGQFDEAEIISFRALDSTRCTPTGDLAAPIDYRTDTGQLIRVPRAHVLRILDSPDPTRPGYGQCGVDRCVEVGRLRQYIAQYFREAFSDRPRPGITILNNINQADWEAQLQAADTARMQKGHQVYPGKLFVTNSEATTPASATDLPNRIAPDGFNQRQTYTEAKEVVATAFGLDPLEFGAMPGQGLGSAEQSTVMAQKSRGKFVAFVLQTIEREFRRVLPANLMLSFEMQDRQEEREQAEVDGLVAENILALAKADPVTGTAIISVPEARQLLADAGILPREFLAADVTGTTEIEETEEEPAEPAELAAGPPEAEGPIVKCWQDGRIDVLRPVRSRPVLAAQKQAEYSPRHPARNVRAARDYGKQLRKIYDDWAKRAAQQLEDADEEDRDALLAALLALLALQLKKAGAAGLYDAMEVGLQGEVPDVDALAALQEAIAKNDYYIESSLVPDAGERLRREAATEGWAWKRDMILAALTAVAWRTDLYVGAFWAAISIGAAVWLHRQNDPPVRRFLDPLADHCATCPPKEGEYENWNDMIARCGGVPGDGSDACDGRCRCGVEALIAGIWVPVL